MNKRSIASSGSRSTRFIAVISIVVASIFTGSLAQARDRGFATNYPSSLSDDNAGCQLCHGASTSTWNEYGWRLRLNNQNFLALENVVSVNLYEDTTFLDEINADTQPGWTYAGNKLYSADGTFVEVAPPSSIYGDLDPNVPPTADPGGPYNGFVGIALTFIGSGSTDPDGTIASFDWNFGDGNTGSGETTAHTYTAAGSYDVVLTVTDDDGVSHTGTTTAAIVAEMRDPVADPGGPYEGLVGFAVLLDASSSFDPDGGGISQFDWDFGDGNTATTFSASQSHTYSDAGTYTLKLIVVDDEGAQSAPTETTVEIQVPQDPIADANGPYEGIEGVELTLDGSGSYDQDEDGSDIAKYNWDYGDGNTALDAGPLPSHTYTTAGTYFVTLTVVDDEGSTDTDTAEVVIAVPPDNLPPLADPGGPYKGTAGNPIKFDGSASSDQDGNIVQYDWDYGDGSAALDAGPTPTHTYKDSGKYDVTLIVTDDDGAVSDKGVTSVEVTTSSSSNGGCSVGGRGVFDPTLPLLLLVALAYLSRRRTGEVRITHRD
jgi:PKD repeat protein